MRSICSPTQLQGNSICDSNNSICDLIWPMLEKVRIQSNQWFTRSDHISVDIYVPAGVLAPFILKSLNAVDVSGWCDACDKIQIKLCLPLDGSVSNCNNSTHSYSEMGTDILNLFRAIQPQRFHSASIVLSFQKMDNSWLICFNGYMLSPMVRQASNFQTISHSNSVKCTTRSFE